MILNNDVKKLGFSGLINIGNTCYINSVIQCLSNDLSFTIPLLEINHDRCSNNKFFDILTSYITILREMWKKNIILKPTSFKRCISYNYPKYNNKYQHDANEFLFDLLESLDKSLQKPVVTITASKYASSHFTSSCKVWRNYFQNNKSLISEKYYGQYIKKYRCRTCNKILYTYDLFLSLFLTIYDKAPTSIGELVASHLTLDFITMECKTCERQAEFDIVPQIWKLPDTLIITINRFSNDMEKKLNPVELDKTLDFSEYIISNSDESVVYTLTALICHEGITLDSGHYYSIVKRNGGYVVYDDDKLYHINFDDINNVSPYVLFYTKKNSK